jgi:hypothetical protein
MRLSRCKSESSRRCARRETVAIAVEFSSDADAFSLDEWEEARESGRMTRIARDGSARVALHPPELALLIDALDAYEYWQLGDVLPRNNGMVWIPGDSIDEVDRYWQDEEPTAEQAGAIAAVQEARGLAERLRDASTSPR